AEIPTDTVRTPGPPSGNSNCLMCWRNPRSRDSKIEESAHASGSLLGCAEPRYSFLVVQSFMTEPLEARDELKLRPPKEAGNNRSLAGIGALLGMTKERWR